MVTKIPLTQGLFTRLSAKDQKAALLDLVQLDIDLDALDEQAKATFANRTRIGQEAKAIGVVTVDESLPEAEQTAGELIAKIRAVEARNAESVRATEMYRRQADEVELLAKNLARLQQQFAEAKAKLTLGEAPIAEIEDTASLEAQLSKVEETNQAIRANNQARGTAHRKAELQGQYEAATDELKRLDKVKADALAAAQFPVEGLSFDEGGVTYQGVPFSQASSAEQIRVSVAMAMAMNPKLRVLRIKDGSLLDAETLEALREQVAENDFQLWLERVGDADEGAVIIDDGQVQA